MSEKDKKEKENNFEKELEEIEKENVKEEKNIFLKYRKTFLILSSLIGIFLSILFLSCMKKELLEPRIYTGLFFILLTLPTSFYLWYLRNQDKLDSIEQQKQNNNFNNFSNAIKLFLEKDNKEANSIGLKLLMELKDKKLFEKQIDLMTQNKSYGDMNLSGADISGANFSNSVFIGTIFSGADLSGANFSNSKIFSVNFSKTDLSRTDISNSDIYEVNFFQAKLKKANLSNSQLLEKEEYDHYLKNPFKKKKRIFTPDRFVFDLRYVNIGELNFSEADLSGADLSGVYFPRAIFSLANLREANLGCTMLPGANFMSANFQKTYLSGADLRNAKLPKADLSEKSLVGTKLGEADIREADLSGSKILHVGLTKKNLDGIKLKIEKKEFEENKKIEVNFIERDFSKLKDPISIIITEKNGEYFLTEDKTKK